MNSKCSAIINYLGGSFLFEALYNITDEQQQKIIDLFIADYGESALDGIIIHVEDGFSTETTPSFK